MTIIAGRIRMRLVKNRRHAIDAWPIKNQHGLYFTLQLPCYWCAAHGITW